MGQWVTYNLVIWQAYRPASLGLTFDETALSVLKAILKHATNFQSDCDKASPIANPEYRVEL